MSLIKILRVFNRAASTGVEAVLPGNVAEYNQADKAQFSKNRNRDWTSRRSKKDTWVEEETENTEEEADKQHVQNYDNFGAVNLNSVMQTNVPEPFAVENFKSPAHNHLNMPGGNTNQYMKYEAFDTQSAHPSKQSTIRGLPKSSRGRVLHGILLPFCYTTNLSRFNLLPAFTPIILSSRSSLNHNFAAYFATNRKIVPLNNPAKLSLNTSNYLTNACMYFHTSNKDCQADASNAEKPNTNQSRRQKLKQAVRDYGSTVVVFHVAISLVSLGFFYLIVSSGVDMEKLLRDVGLESSAVTASFAAGASTFVVSYAVHKVFAPVRIATTLAVTPVIVRYLRTKGILKPPKIKT